MHLCASIVFIRIIVKSFVHHFLFMHLCVKPSGVISTTYFQFGEPKGTGVTGVCVLSDGGAGKWKHVLWKTRGTPEHHAPPTPRPPQASLFTFS